MVYHRPLMANAITNKMLLEHMQAMKQDLLRQISGLDTKVGGLDAKVSRLEERVERGFEDARLHRQALQEDLEATMRMLAKHEAKLVRL